MGVGPSDQRMVEMAGIAFVWIVVPEAFWHPLLPAERDRAARWMLRNNDAAPSDDNWLFFRVLVNLALARPGPARPDPAWPGLVARGGRGGAGANQPLAPRR
ncbi:MAG: hypothetical protein ACJASC_003353 [Limimaricola cinnabarinus]|jgi:hypothetical protein